MKRRFFFKSVIGASAAVATPKIALPDAPEKKPDVVDRSLARAMFLKESLRGDALQEQVEELTVELALRKKLNLSNEVVEKLEGDCENQFLPDF